MTDNRAYRYIAVKKCYCLARQFISWHEVNTGTAHKHELNRTFGSPFLKWHVIFSLSLAVSSASLVLFKQFCEAVPAVSRVTQMSVRPATQFGPFTLAADGVEPLEQYKREWDADRRD